MDATRDYQALMTVHFEAGGFAVGVVTSLGIPLYYLMCHMSCQNEGADKAIEDAARTVWEKQDMGASETFAVAFRGRVRWLTNKEWRTSNMALSAPICWGMVEIEEVLSIGKPVGWQVFLSNLILVCLWVAGMALLFLGMPLLYRGLGWYIDTIIHFVRG